MQMRRIHKVQLAREMQRKINQEQREKDQKKKKSLLQKLFARG
tara:strand:+ start:358 stop:486 length:129 start_codon:yes stop_codon:yes gene_type:complete